MNASPAAPTPAPTPTAARPGEAAVVSARELVKSYPGPNGRPTRAVDGLSFHIEPGERFGLLGPNGAGKSTTIRMIHGFTPLDSGSMRVFGLDVTEDWRAIRARLGVCQQDNALDPDLSVQENLLIFAGYFLMPGKLARRRADELLEFMSLSAKRASRVSELSGGMARRLMIARSLINSPELLILDEPTTGLDPQSRRLVWERLEDLSGQGVTILLTTHYMDEAQRLCDRLLIMDAGARLIEGRPEEMVARHAGEAAVEVDDPAPGLADRLREKALSFDVSGGHGDEPECEERLVIYAPSAREAEEIMAWVRTEFSPRRSTIRRAGLEDVFLRLTGRELRE